MRSFPIRRNTLFALASLIFFLVFLQFTFGSTMSFQPSILYLTRKVPGRWFVSSLDDSSVILEDIRGDATHSTKPEPLIGLKLSENVRESPLVWGTGNVPTTEIKMHVPGWTVFDRLYIFNGTVFVVTDQPEKIPDRMLLTSSGYPLLTSLEDVAKRTPTDEDMQIISPQKAVELFGPYATRLGGVSFVINDPVQFINHYYHWSAEVFFGLWRAYSTLDPNITADGLTSLPPPKRITLVRVPRSKWNDYASMNRFVTRGSFPAVSTEFQEDWQDRASMSHAFVFELVVFTDRAAATHSANVERTLRSNAELITVPTSPHWWSTIRNNLIEFAGSDPHRFDDKVITYVSRQEWGRRMLLPEDHQRLVAALEALRERHGYEVNVVSMDKLTREQQFRLAGRTTIMMGVHGNGLTSLLWMKPSRKTTVMEFFYPGGFARDYEWTARALGMKHYGFWGHEYFTSPDLPPIAYPKGFQGNEIPIDGEAVARLCHERLSLLED